MQLLATGRSLGFHHRINRFSHVVLFGDYEKRVAMWKPPEQTKDKEWKHRTTCHTVFSHLSLIEYPIWFPVERVVVG